MTACPSTEQLEALLADCLGSAEQDALDAHVSQCPGCQEARHQLTAASFLALSTLRDREPAYRNVRMNKSDAAPDEDFLDKLKHAWPAEPRREETRGGAADD